MNDRTSPAPDDWTLVYEGFDPEEEGRREALCTLGNGRFATRGAAGGRGEPGEGWVRWGEAEVLDHRVELRMREGLLVRRTRFRDDSGRETTVREVLETDTPAPDELFLRVRTTQSRLEVALATQSDPLVLEKVVALATSRDHASRRPGTTHGRRATGAPSSPGKAEATAPKRPRSST